jgi:hypothetical protein
MPHLPRLTSVEFFKTPFSKQPFYRVALLILFGKTLRLIDGERINGTERQIAASYPQGSDSLVRAGWIVTYPPPTPAEMTKIKANLPVHLTNERTRKSKTSHTTYIHKSLPQSKVLEDVFAAQDEEMRKLAEEIQSMQSEGLVD